jgi:purine-nucleoside phosphorylase
MPPGESFDERVFAAAAALAERGVSAPHALFFLGTGAGVLPGRLEEARRLPLSLAPGVPAAWGEALLHYGELNSLPVWVIEDAPADADDGEPAWAAAFPVWLAAAAGAVSLIHTAAGSALDLGADSLALGTLALVSDHLNLSGATPLIGLGKTRLGPMFPDQTMLHDQRLRAQALALCRRLGLAAREVVAVGTLGPAIETPAERRWFARAGGAVSVQRLATTLLAAAHAGLGALCVVAVTHAGDGPVDIGQAASISAELAPALDDLLVELARHAVAEAVADLERESG